MRVVVMALMSPGPGRTMSKPCLAGCGFVRGRDGGVPGLRGGLVSGGPGQAWGHPCEHRRDLRAPRGHGVAASRGEGERDVALPQLKLPPEAFGAGHVLRVIRA